MRKWRTDSVSSRIVELEVDDPEIVFEGGFYYFGSWEAAKDFLLDIAQLKVNGAYERLIESKAHLAEIESLTK